MKSDGVQRGIRKRSDRTAGSAPSIGRVARMPGTGLAKGERRTRRRGERDNQGRTERWNARLTLGWSIGFAVIAAALVVSAVVLWLKPLLGRKAGGDELAVMPKVRVVSRFPSPTEAEAVGLVQQVIERARDVEAVGRWVDRGEMTSLEVVGFLEGLPELDGKVERYQWMASGDANDLQLEVVVVISKKGDEYSYREAFLRPDEKGVWKMDFPSFARQVKPSWKEIHDEKTRRAFVRVYLGDDTYYNGPFLDESKWVCYGMATLDDKRLMLGYCEVGSKQHRAMLEILRRSAAKQQRVGSATLEISRVEGAESRQFQITKVIAEGWVTQEEAFED